MKPKTTIGGYEVLLNLSAGGMGQVSLAKKSGAHGFEKLFALKTIRTALKQDNVVRAMFLDEARLAARLSDSAIAQVYDFGEEGGVLYLAMEYVAGVAIGNILKKNKEPWPPRVAVQLLVEACRGLHSAHELKDLRGQPLA